MVTFIRESRRYCWPQLTHVYSDKGKGRVTPRGSRSVALHANASEEGDMRGLPVRAPSLFLLSDCCYRRNDDAVVRGFDCVGVS